MPSSENTTYIPLILSSERPVHSFGLKELENDLIDYKITIDPEADSLINDSDLRDFEMPDGGRNSRV